MAWTWATKLTGLLVDALRSTAQTEQKTDINHKRAAKTACTLAYQF